MNKRIKPNKKEQKESDMFFSGGIEGCLIEGCHRKAKFPFHLCEVHLQESGGQIKRHYTLYAGFRAREGWKTGVK